MPKIKLIRLSLFEIKLILEFCNLIDWEPFWRHQIKNFQSIFYLPSTYLSMQKIALIDTVAQQDKPI